ncbi:hypothetical protein ACTA71_004580 [Dictyostelium dimigraforme]
MATSSDKLRIPHYFTQSQNNGEAHLLSNSNNEDYQNRFNKVFYNMQNKKKKTILKRIKKHIIFILLIVIVFLFLLDSRKQLSKTIEDQKYQYEQLLENQKQNQKQNNEQNKDLSNKFENHQTILEQIQKQNQGLSNQFETHQTIFEQFETNFNIKFIFENKVIYIKSIDRNLFIRSNGNVPDLTSIPLEWERFIILQSGIPDRYLIKSIHFGTFLFFNKGANTLSMKPHPEELECPTFKFIKTNFNDQYQIETCLGFLIKSSGANLITIKKENSIVGTHFLFQLPTSF